MGLVMCCYITGFQQKSIRTSKKSRDMAPWEASCLLTNGFLLYFCVRETDTLCVTARNEAVHSNNLSNLPTKKNGELANETD